MGVAHDVVEPHERRRRWKPTNASYENARWQRAQGREGAAGHRAQDAIALDAARQLLVVDAGRRQARAPTVPNRVADNVDYARGRRDDRRRERAAEWSPHQERGGAPQGI